MFWHVCVHIFVSLARTFCDTSSLLNSSIQAQVMAWYRRASQGYRRRAPSRRRTPVTRRSYTRPARRRAPVRRKRTTMRAPSDSKSGCSCSADLSTAQKFILAQLDPFDPRCFGAKIPDSSTIPSLSVVDVENNALTLTTATNSKAWAFLPQYTTAIVSSTEGAGSWTWAAAFGGRADRAKRASYIAAYELDRPVAHAIRISSPVAPTAATGFVHIAVGFESTLNTTTWEWPTTTGGLSGYQFYKRVTLASLTQSPLTLINKFVDETAFRYASANSGVSAAGFSSTQNEFHIWRSWGAIIIAVEGVNSTSPIDIEHLLLTESVPNASGVISGSTAAPFQPSILAGAGHASANTDFAHTEMQQDGYINQGLAAVAEGMQAAGNQAFQSFVLPLAQQVGYQGVAAAVNYGLGIGGVNNNPNRLMA